MRTDKPLQSDVAQGASAVLMVRPASFAENPETRGSNQFQSKPRTDCRELAVREFDLLRAALMERAIEVVCLAGNELAALPDEVFPNNWFSTHSDGTLVVYPMAANSRRPERRTDLDARLGDAGFRIRRRIDLSHFERTARYLEGTGSLVLDHRHRLAFATPSPRTDATLVRDWCSRMGFSPILFDTFLKERPAYHTNVVLAIGSGWALFAADATAAEQRSGVIERLETSGRRVVAISCQQAADFCCNALELTSPGGPIIALSKRALGALSAMQRRFLESRAELVPVAIPQIETVGGGSVRCMLAELRLPRIS